MQASYTDIILINKWEHVSDQHLDIVFDHLHTLNDLTPKIRCKDRKVDPNLIFGIESKLFMDNKEFQSPTHNDEVQTLRLRRGRRTRSHAENAFGVVNKQKLDDALKSLSKESIWRVKGFVRLDEEDYILNWAFGRYDLTNSEMFDKESVIDLTVMGERGEVRRVIQPFCRNLGLEIV
ncbi:hypothetical protein E1B28_011383 [Marasmius oreades]|nr:uncharacterized protein E1B28_011383 [Marasmius oreades]KAG7089729.1 hypothetical protein E1B28_011383 [Marasmius oreades]